VSEPLRRNSDRWVTPGVVVAVILTAGVVTLGITAALVYLAAIGRDPEPVLSMFAQIVGAITGPLAIGLQVANRASIAKAERNTGVAPARTAELVEQRLYGGPPPDPMACPGHDAAPAGAGRLPA
jgi:hypothetical protein